MWQLLHAFNVIINRWHKLQSFCRHGSEISRKFNAISILFCSHMSFICQMYTTDISPTVFNFAERYISPGSIQFACLTFKITEPSFFKSGKAFSIRRCLSFFYIFKATWLAYRFLGYSYFCASGITTEQNQNSFFRFFSPCLHIVQLSLLQCHLHLVEHDTKAISSVLKLFSCCIIFLLKFVSMLYHTYDENETAY